MNYIVNMRFREVVSTTDYQFMQSSNEILGSNLASPDTAESDGQQMKLKDRLKAVRKEKENKYMPKYEIMKKVSQLKR
jgi:hypothetical protein